jgi:hypothetical protein
MAVRASHDEIRGVRYECHISTIATDSWEAAVPISWLTARVNRDRLYRAVSSWAVDQKYQPV